MKNLVSLLKGDSKREITDTIIFDTEGTIDRCSSLRKKLKDRILSKDDKDGDH